MLPAESRPIASAAANCPLPVPADPNENCGLPDELNFVTFACPVSSTKELPEPSPAMASASVNELVPLLVHVNAAPLAAAVATPSAAATLSTRPSRRRDARVPRHRPYFR